MTNKKIESVYQDITDNIIEMLEEGVGSWEMPWSKLLAGFPENAVTNRNYSGINVLQLASVGMKKSYKTNLWAGMKQWNKVGCKVKKGEQSTLVLKPFIKEIKDENDEVIERIPLPSWYRVFNIEQVSGVEENPELLARFEQAKASMDNAKIGLDDQKIADIEDMVEKLGIRIRPDARAFYNRGGDYIGMPPPAAFSIQGDPEASMNAYYATLLHEVTHYTGHESRCNREFGKRFGDKKYAFEELVAELGSAFLCHRFGVQSTFREDHAAYIQSWIKKLKKDNRAIFKASTLAQQAVDYIESALEGETKVEPSKAA